MPGLLDLARWKDLQERRDADAERMQGVAHIEKMKGNHALHQRNLEKSRG